MRTRFKVTNLAVETVEDGHVTVTLRSEAGTTLYGPSVFGLLSPLPYIRFRGPKSPPIPHPNLGASFVLHEETADEEEREKIIGEALSRARLALTALDLCENESGNGRFAGERLEEGRDILAALCKYLVDRDAIDPLEQT